MITVDRDVDESGSPALMAEVFNTIQRQFDVFDEWTEDLGLILSGDANIQAMLERSAEIFQNPLLVIDANFAMLGAYGFPARRGL